VRQSLACLRATRCRRERCRSAATAAACTHDAGQLAVCAYLCTDGRHWVLQQSVSGCQATMGGHTAEGENMVHQACGFTVRPGLTPAKSVCPGGSRSASSCPLSAARERAASAPGRYVPPLHVLTAHHLQTGHASECCRAQGKQVLHLTTAGARWWRCSGSCSQNIARNRG
jgi:hypothetical protein